MPMTFLKSSKKICNLSKFYEHHMNKLADIHKVYAVPYKVVLISGTTLRSIFLRVFSHKWKVKFIISASLVQKFIFSLQMFKIIDKEHISHFVKCNGKTILWSSAEVTGLYSRI
jgi:hypothetical protein